MNTPALKSAGLRKALVSKGYRDARPQNCAGADFPFNLDSSRRYIVTPHPEI